MSGVPSIPYRRHIELLGEAEQRATAKALRRCADAVEAPISTLTRAVSSERLAELRAVVHDMRVLAADIESGEVTP